MVAKKVTVLSRSFGPEETGWQWTSEGMGGYETRAAADLPRGTKITLELKDDAKDFAAGSDGGADHRTLFKLRSLPHRAETRKRLNTVQAVWRGTRTRSGGGIQRVLHVRRA